jgi:hypothetical protein
MDYLAFMIVVFFLVCPKAFGKQIAEVMNAYDAARTNTGSEK